MIVEDPKQNTSVQQTPTVQTPTDTSPFTNAGNIIDDGTLLKKLNSVNTAPPISAFDFFRQIGNSLYFYDKNSKTWRICIENLVTNGLTGATSFTDGGVLIGNGTGTVQSTSAGTAGQIFTSNGTGVDPTFQDNEGYAINANEATSSWFTSELKTPEGVGGLYGWTISFTPTTYANGSSFSANGSVTGIHSTGFYDAFLGNTTNAAIDFATARTIKTKFLARTPTPTGTTGGKNAFIGYAPSAAATAGDLTDTATVRVGFAFYDSSIYAVSCNGTNLTSTLIQAYSGTLESFTLKLNGTSSAQFYVDGVLGATISTNIPSASSKVKIMVGGQDGGGGGCGFTFLSHFITSQKAS